MGYITHDGLVREAQKLKASSYGQYLIRLADELGSERVLGNTAPGR